MCQLIPPLWVGHRATTGEGQEDSTEDQTFQDETSTESSPLCRCKTIWLSVDIHYWQIERTVNHFAWACGCFHDLLCLGIHLCTCKHIDIFFKILVLVFVCCLCGQAHLCAYIWIIFTYSVFNVVLLISVSRWWVGTSVHSLNVFWIHSSCHSYHLLDGRRAL